jgi:hypothetical protein
MPCNHSSVIFEMTKSRKNLVLAPVMRTIHERLLCATLKVFPLRMKLQSVLSGIAAFLLAKIP